MKNTFLLFLLIFNFTSIAYSFDFEVTSPDGKIQFKIILVEDNHLGYEISFLNKTVIDRSPLGIIIENNDIGKGVKITSHDPYRVDETYPSRGTHASAENKCNGSRISVIQVMTAKTYTLDVRVFNDGVGFRIIVPEKGLNVVGGESTRFILLPGNVVWYHDLYMHYEGKHDSKAVEEIKNGEWAAPPITIKLKGELGYASITEADLVNYAGMALQADGNSGFQVRLGHEQPVSYPYELRYGMDEAERLKKPAAIDGPIITPWRVIMIAADLNTLVNSDILTNLCPPADKTIFSNGFDTDWLKPGRAVWGYLTDQPRTLEGMKEMSLLAGELGFEYQVVEGHWAHWPDNQQKELVDYSARHGVKILLWKHSKELRDPQKREEFFQHCEDLGAAGAKIDFFDHEAKETIDLYEVLLKDAARHHLVLDFHGANKPTGLIRTWPNELSREAVKGLESRGPWAKHNCTLPFTRFLAGDADYTPLHFGARRAETSEAHQIATAIIFQSALLVYAEHPRHILNHKALSLIKEIPSTWDETIVLPGSEIGEVAAYARRKGNTWFLAVLNGEHARHFTVSLNFLGENDYHSLLVRDLKSKAAGVSFTATRRYFGDLPSVQVDTTIVSSKKNEGMIIELQPGGGFAAMFKP